MQERASRASDLGSSAPAPLPLRHRQLRDVVYESLREDIVGGIHPVGVTLREMDIATTLGVSKTPVREAFAKLATEGLVRLVPYRGAIVTDYSPEDLESISGVRQLVEGACAARAATRRSPDQLELMRQILSDSEQALARDDSDGVLTKFLAFDEVIYGFADNEWFEELIAMLRAHQSRILRLTVQIPGRMAESASEHRGILQAITDRDEEAAELLTRQHVASVMAAHRAALWSS